MNNKREEKLYYSNEFVFEETLWKLDVVAYF